MLISTIIPTIGRASLDRAVNSVLAQETTIGFEIVVANDSGIPLLPASWQQSPRVRIVDTPKQERGAARNAGAAIARGKYLHFLDDDDWLLPGAYRALTVLTEESTARWLYGSSQLVDRRGKPLIELHHELNGNIALPVMAGEWIPLQSSIFAAGLFSDLGGFDPHIPGAEDIDLTRRAAMHTQVRGTRDLVACIGMGSENSTTNYVESRRSMRFSREKILGQPDAFSKLRAGATTAYWSGRLLRIYLTSALLNLEQGKWAASWKRTETALHCLRHSLPAIFTTDFWHALGSPYRNESFARGFEQAAKDD